MAIQNYSAVLGQSILDVCLQVYGTLDLLYKLIQDSGIDSINVSPLSGQIFVYDDALATDQAQINKNFQSGIVYATEIGSNGSVYYIIKQNNPQTFQPGAPSPSNGPVNPSPIIITDMPVYGASYTSNADGTTVIYPLDVNGLSMAGRGLNIIQIEKEIKPLANSLWQWNSTAGSITLLGGTTLDNTESIFYLYQ